MADDDDLRAFVDSLTDADVASIASKIMGNLSTELLQVVNEPQLLQQQQQQFLGFVSPVNRTLKLQCLQQEQQQRVEDEMQLANKSCPVSFDSVLCWPRTPAGTWAILPCFEEFKGVHYDTTENATRYCFPNGSWHSYTDYDKCHQAEMLPVIPDFATSIELPAIIYSIGYFLSFAALVLALILFLSFKDLKCLRNTIHANLFLTYITSALLWILTLFLQVITTESSAAGCITLVIMFHYFYLTNFFWMFVEGLYLYTLVVQTYSSENISFMTYAFIGWGVPVIIIAVWSIAKVFAPDLDSDHFNGLEIECAWMRESHIDWIFKAPASVVLLLNLIFLICIMWVLITKLRSANTQETRQYYKAAKALLVLIPLFGITYLLVLRGPEQGISRNLFEAVRAFLISTQGFFVSLLFCFLNSEVKQAIHHRLDRWQSSRNLRRGNSAKQRRYGASKDYSQRSRTESLRLTSTSPAPNGSFD